MKKRILPLVCSALLMFTGLRGRRLPEDQPGEGQRDDGHQEVLVLDVREQSEYAGGHIPGAVLLPVGTIDEDTAAASSPKRTPPSGLLPQRQPQQAGRQGPGRHWGTRHL